MVEFAKWCIKIRNHGAEDVESSKKEVLVYYMITVCVFTLLRLSPIVDVSSILSSMFCT